jgi:hypothetical protein
VNSWSAVMPTLLSTTALRRSVRPRAASASVLIAAAGTSAASTGRSGRTGAGAAVWPAASASRTGLTCPAVTSALTVSSRARAPAPSVRHWWGGATTIGPVADGAERDRAEEVLRGQRAVVAREGLGGGRGAGTGRRLRGRGGGGGARQERVGEEPGDRPARRAPPRRCGPCPSTVSGESTTERAPGGRHDVERRAVEQAVGGPGDVGRDGGLQQRREDLPPGPERARRGVGEASRG